MYIRNVTPWKLECNESQKFRQEQIVQNNFGNHKREISQNLFTICLILALLCLVFEIGSSMAWWQVISDGEFKVGVRDQALSLGQGCKFFIILLHVGTTLLL